MAKKLDKCVLILSGGMDSTVLYYHLLAQGKTVFPLTFNYGQRHSREIYSAIRLTHLGYGNPVEVVSLPELGKILGGSSQTDMDVEVPEGHYADEDMKLTVVPNRNMIMLSIAAGYALSHGIDELYYAAHAGDHTIYPDCRPEFVEALNKAMKIADWQGLELIAPFLSKTKGEIAKLGVELNVPFHLTWTCYKGLEKHCGKCGACVERREAFEFAGITDPTEYQEEEEKK